MTNVDNPFQSPAVLSFCPGVLGLERGLERAIGKLNIVAYCEIESFIIANLVTGMEASVLAPAPIWSDAKTFPAQGFRGKIHGIIGGYPCQPFSTAGNRKGHEDPRHLWPHLRRHIDTIRPVWCFFENVAGHLTLGYDTVQKELNDLGYSVEPGIFSAEEVGAPHQRKRLFILAVADSYLNGYRTGTSRITKESCETEGEKQRKEWHQILGQWMRDVIGNSGKTLVKESFQSLAAGVGQGLEGFGSRESCATSELSLSSSISSDRWPARPGEHQYEWEEPRTIEPGLGITIDGYNFREDLLRALGNSVVEQIAELAFITLLQKHLTTLNR